VCYVLALQAFLAAFGTSFAVSSGNGDFVICHGDASADAGRGTNTGKAPCALCAIAAGASGLLPQPAAALHPAAGAGQRIMPVRTAEAVIQRPARAGFSRGPPILA
jgi:hypothetical protein